MIELTTPVTTTTVSTSDLAPVVIDLGKKRRKDIKKLRKGRPGKLMQKVHEVLQHLKVSGVNPDSSQPVIIVVRERVRAPRMFGR